MIQIELLIQWSSRCGFTLPARYSIKKIRTWSQCHNRNDHFVAGVTDETTAYTTEEPLCK